MYMQIQRLVFVGILATALLLFLQPNCRADDALAVHTTDGRMLTAEIDSRTNDSQLWLRLATPSTVVTRAISWENVDRVTRLGKPVAREQVIQWALTPEKPSSAPSNPRLRQATALPSGLSMAQLAQQALAGSNHIARVRFQARTTREAGTPMLRVRILATDDQDRPVAMEGILHVDAPREEMPDNHALRRIDEFPANGARRRVPLEDFDGTSVVVSMRGAEEVLNHSRQWLWLYAEGHGWFEETVEAH